MALKRPPPSPAPAEVIHQPAVAPLTKDNYTIVLLRRKNGKTPLSHVLPTASLVKASPYFAALSKFKEGGEGIVELEDVDEKGFQLVARYLQSCDLSDVFQDASLYLTMDEVRDLIRAYVVADRLLLTDLKNGIMDRLRSNSSRDNEPTAIMRLFSESGANSSLPVVQFHIDQLSWEYIYSSIIDHESWSSVKTFYAHGEAAKSEKRLEVHISNKDTLTWEILTRIWHECRGAARGWILEQNGEDTHEPHISELLAVLKSSTIWSKICSAMDMLVHTWVYGDGFDLDELFQVLAQRKGSLAWSMTEKVRCNVMLQMRAEEWCDVPVQPKTATGCKYHDHADGEPCNTKKSKYFRH